MPNLHVVMVEGQIFAIFLTGVHLNHNYEISQTYLLLLTKIKEA